MFFKRLIYPVLQVDFTNMFSLIKANRFDRCHLYFAIALNAFSIEDCNHSSPKLYHNCILTCSNKGFDVQQLFDVSEEYFDIPAAFI